VTRAKLVIDKSYQLLRNKQELQATLSVILVIVARNFQELSETF
jgi:hypothetical protein